jgi:hypothetical protein
MGGIIFWSVLTLIWITSLIIDLTHISDEMWRTPILSVLMFVLSLSMLVTRIDNYKAEKMFDSLIIGQTYTGTIDDNPFKRETITIINMAKTKNKQWVQYRTSSGDTVVSKITDMTDFFNTK